MTTQPQPARAALASAPFPELLAARQAAEMLNVPEGTLAIWRSTKRYALPYVKVGRKVRYRRADLITWLDKRVQQLGQS
jgi:excisionase family DNA binding protein